MGAGSDPPCGRSSIRGCCGRTCTRRTYGPLRLAQKRPDRGSLRRQWRRRPVEQSPPAPCKLMGRSTARQSRISGRVEEVAAPGGCRPEAAQAASVGTGRSSAVDPAASGHHGGGGIVSIPGGLSGQTSSTAQGAWSTTNRVAEPKLCGPRREWSPSRAATSRSTFSATAPMTSCPTRHRRWMSSTS